MKKLPRDFYTHPDVTHVAQNLLGKKLVTLINRKLTSGIIVETEAYCGRGDKACHANNNLRTKRTEVMYKNGGLAYVYKCYGIHNMFNVVTNKKGLADAVLIRALEPLDGIDYMKQRRKTKDVKQLASGPGKLTQAMGIDLNLNGVNLNTSSIWIEDCRTIPLDQIEEDIRIGVEYAGEDALKLWRFFPQNNSFISKKKQEQIIVNH